MDEKLPYSLDELYDYFLNSKDKISYVLLNNESVKLIAEKDLVKSPEALKPLNKVFKSMNRHPIFIVHNKNNPEYVILVIETNSINPLVDQPSMELSSFCKSLVPTSDHSFTQSKYLFNMSKITLLNKKPFDGLRAPIALEILKESELVIYFNSLIGRFEIYSKNDYYKNKFSGSNIIDAFYSNPDFLTLDILENKLLPNHTSDILRSELEDIFRLGYIYIINKEQELGYDFNDFRQQQNNFSYDRENTNNECYYVFSKDPIQQR